MPSNQSLNGLCASAIAHILGQGTSTNIRFEGLAEALDAPQTQVRLFGKPDIDGRRKNREIVALFSP